MLANSSAVAYVTLSVCDWPFRISGARPSRITAIFSSVVLRAT
jgi:hypothetical protein